MKHSIATVSLSGTLPEKLKAIAAAGFDGVEIFENDLLYFDGSPKEVRDMCHDLNLDIMLFQPFRDFEGGPRDRLQRNLERAERKFDLMQELGTDKILVCSSVAPNVMCDDAIIADDLHQLAELAAKRDIMIGYEALAWGKHVFSYKHAWQLVKTVNHAHLGIILDSFHTMSILDDLSELEQIPGEKIVFVQLADAPYLKMDVMEWSRHFRNFPGQGDFGLASFLAPILASGYQGPLSLEVFNDGFRAAPTTLTAADARKSLRYLEEITLNRMKAHVPPIVPIQPLFSPPPAAEYKGVEFLEFAVDEESGERLGKVLEQFSFTKTGQHKSKAVTLYQQGDINLILNAEPDSFAHAFFVAHGPSLCASAFAIGEASSALERATQYGCKPFESRVGPKERHIPAVRAPDGSLQYFVDAGDGKRSIYHADFELQPTVNTLLSSIDHFAIGLPAETMDNWVLHFRTVFGFVTEHEWTLPDPYGLMKSRVVRSTNNTVRIPLNISENRNTAIARSVSTYKGSGLQHIAFSTQDIFAAVALVRSNGVALLEISDNYYDDLLARFSLEEAFVDQLKAHNILYDADQWGGGFLHVYSQPFEERFFFEIVQRMDGYDQYGAVNTPVRLAAQTQHRKKSFE